jgi:hypothetical protein
MRVLVISVAFSAFWEVMRWRAWRTLAAVSLLGRPGGFFGRLGQYWERIWDIVEVLTPVAVWILSTEVPDERRAMMLLRLFSGSGGMLIVEGIKVAQGPVYIEEYPSHMIKPNTWLNNTTWHLYGQSCDQQQNPSPNIPSKNDLYLNDYLVL